jgi:hypothetical protein
MVPLDLQTRQEKADAYFTEQLRWFERHRDHARLAARSVELLTILLAALTPVLHLVGGIPGWGQALPAALAAGTASLATIWNWKANWIHHAVVAEGLKRERVKYDTRATPRYRPDLDDEIALGSFVEAVTAIGAQEVGEWADATRSKPTQDA